MLVTSQGVADDLVNRFGVSREHVDVVHNPVDLDAIATGVAGPAPPGDRWPHPAIVAAGRLAEAKNYPLLIDAVALLERLSYLLVIAALLLIYSILPVPFHYFNRPNTD